jgi:hypothetical protein
MANPSCRDQAASFQLRKFALRCSGARARVPNQLGGIEASRAVRQGSRSALLSLGATRRMTIRAKAAPRRSLHVDLETGSLLVMDYSTQIHYTHGVPETSATIGERISLAFRVKSDQPKANGDGVGDREPLRMGE